MKRIGVFDSGIGGAEFAKALKSRHPDFLIKVVHDKKNIPYGDKSPRAIQKLTDFAIQPLIGADAIVIACNTATAYAIDFLRTKYPGQKFVGFEPGIKVAREKTKSDAIAVLATPATLKSSRYIALKQAYGNGLTIYEPNVSTWASQIEHKSISWISIKKLIKELTSQNVDCIILGCTHYHLLADNLQEFAGKNVHIITPTSAVIIQIEKLLEL
jgi:glutamate racemase